MLELRNASSSATPSSTELPLEHMAQGAWNQSLSLDCQNWGNTPFKGKRHFPWLYLQTLFSFDAKRCRTTILKPFCIMHFKSELKIYIGFFWKTHMMSHVLIEWIWFPSPHLRCSYAVRAHGWATSSSLSAPWKKSSLRGFVSFWVSRMLSPTSIHVGARDVSGTQCGCRVFTILHNDRNAPSNILFKVGGKHLRMSQIYPGEMGIQVTPPAIYWKSWYAILQGVLFSAFFVYKEGETGHLAKLACDDVPLVFIALFAVELLLLPPSPIPKPCI